MDENGKIIPECKGKTFDVFIAALRSLNYIVDWKVLCAADYGAPTSRKRLFIQCVRKDCGKKIIWPSPTNVKGGDLILPDWHSASEIIDWSIPSQIISRRKNGCKAYMVRELHKKTSKGIEGLEKLEADTEKEVNDIEKLREKDFQNELDVGFYFSVVFDTKEERDKWCKEHNIKLIEDFFVKAKDFKI